MVQGRATIQNLTGLQVRPAGQLCDEARKFSCKVEMVKGTTIANAKSFLSVLGAGVKFGEEIEFICEGEDEEEALAALLQLVENRFGE